MYTANAHTPGPYCTGALISSGKSLRCMRPQAQVPATTRYSVTSRWMTSSMTWRRSGNSSALICDRQRPQVQAPSRPITTKWLGASTRARVAPLWPFCPPGLRPLAVRWERGGGLRKGGSDDGGLLELWLSLARRASSSAIRWRSCSMRFACSATSARSCCSSIISKSVAGCSSGMAQGYALILLSCKGS